MITSTLLVGLVRALVGAHGRWIGCAPSSAQRIYFANHSSHLDTLALWAALPAKLRTGTRPVAARDYWGHGGIRGFVADHGFRAVYLDRDASTRDGDPLQPLMDALDAGDSLIIFPEGTRSQEALPQAFRSGLFHLAQRYPKVELVAVYLDTLHRSMPKGSLLPVPLTCTVRFGRCLQWRAGEDKAIFLDRARSAVVELA
ncbi:lysophospholipid acyltransferase family protein [Rhodanobacter sp. L36]|uniref:lysophospholipid acyltransferase family protein n=1 Tax=Rhodanobacter sp. L36 TaxID=1747221 RepID=UPI00131A68F9|nr:lysophospholipid acyltransferase family protein [Rhodanobacter sp. L36]